MPETQIDHVVEAVRADLLSRSQIGIKKYGVTLDRTDLSLRDWLQHAYEETLDQANYLKRAILELDQIWARPTSEMDDGRFEATEASQSPSSTPGEVERLVDALIEAARFAGKTEAMGAWCAGKAADDLATARTALLSHISTAARAEGPVFTPTKSTHAMTRASYTYWHQSRAPSLFADEQDYLSWIEGIVNAALSAPDATTPTDRSA